MAANKLKILIVWGESMAKPSGGTVHCVGLANGFVKGGHDVRIITPCYKGQKLPANDLDVRGAKLPAKSGFSFALFQFMTIFCLPWWILIYKADIVYVRTCFFQCIMSMICRLMRRPLVGEVDGLVDREVLIRGQSKLLAWVTRVIDKFSGFFSSGLVCVSEGCRKEFVENRWSNSNTTVAIHNGAMVDVMKPLDRVQMREKFNLSQNEVILGFAGSFAPWQGLGFLVDSAVSMKQNDTLKNIRFAIMGVGVQQEQIRDTITRQGLGDVFTFFKPGDHKRVVEFLSACDAVVIPRNDKRIIGVCSPLKFFDGISMGLPVLVPAGSEFDDILEMLGVPGVFDPASPQNLGDEIIKLSQNIGQYRPRRREIHQMVREKYSWDNVADKTIELFEKLLKK